MCQFNVNSRERGLRDSLCSKASLLVTVLLALWLPSLTAFADDESLLHELLNGLHQDAAEANYASYFNRYKGDAIFLGTDRSERWNMAEFKAYAKPIFDAGRGWAYRVVERNLEGEGDVRWFDEVLDNDKLGPCRGTGVLVKTPEGWRIAHYSLTLLIPNDIAEAVGAQSKALSNDD